MLGYSDELPYCQYLEENDKHDWIHLGTADDGTVFMRCRCCGIESEI